ncbi:MULTISPECIES: FxLD family lanthipeptide [unclassified Streptomyces]|uniref:FxLD family lanthipeptide n=1 Tax=unclassified Streptomyces TaxID=2593676 RepID=UPI002E2E63B1|nr:FxLD family lanthipeptide [Streptomyces sp. NBC_00223]
MTSATLAPGPVQTALDDDFAPLDVKVVIAAHPFGKLQCSTSDGCGTTCANGASACNSFVEDPA